ncbi:hypothetical protein Tco_0089386 [Tanacetum coccineum]
MPPKKTTTPMTDAAIKALISQVVATALAEYEANRGSGNGDDSHDSGSGRRTERAALESDIRKNLYNALVESYNTDKDIITSYGNVRSLLLITETSIETQDKDARPLLDGSNIAVAQVKKKGVQAKRLLSSSERSPNNKRV